MIPLAQPFIRVPAISAEFCVLHLAEQMINEAIIKRIINHINNFISITEKQNSTREKYTFIYTEKQYGFPIAFNQTEIFLASVLFAAPLLSHNCCP